MTRASRTRSRIKYVSSSGSVVRTYPPNPSLYPPTVVGTVGPHTLGSEVVSDYVGPPWIDSPFTKKEGKCPRILLNGTRTQTGFVYTSTNLPMNSGACTLYMSEPYNHANFTLAPIAGSTLAAMAMANMNPNKPDIDFPVSILELRELPQLLKDALYIRRFPARAGKKSAKANLMAQFGVLPIARDLLTLFNFAQAVDNREKYLRSLSAGKKRIKRKLTAESWDRYVYDLVPWHPLADNQTSTNKFHIHGHMNRDYWFTARAQLLDPPSERELRSVSERIASGTDTITATQIWNLIPWTWLIDWFFDTGTLLQAYRGGLKWQYEGLNVMYKTTYDMTGTFPNVRTGFMVSWQKPCARAWTLERIQPVVSIYPTFRIPYLTGRQWSILLSLACIKL
jgi:hypothetical protein